MGILYIHILQEEEAVRGEQDGIDEGTIVKQLIARGYSKNGAIKAARAVGKC